MQRLKIDAERVNWQVIQKSSSITLRPMGESPSLRLWVTRFGIFSIPVTLVMALAFRDLAGEGLEFQGLLFGASCGLVIVALAYHIQGPLFLVSKLVQVIFQLGY